jgi:hypothetical protein
LGNSTKGDNRSIVLHGWLDHLSDTTGKMLTPKMIADFPYQLIHRAASLFTVPAARRWLIYEAFEDTETKASIPNLLGFKTLLGNPPELQVALMRCAFRPVGGFAELVEA